MLIRFKQSRGLIYSVIAVKLYQHAANSSVGPMCTWVQPPAVSDTLGRKTNSSTAGYALFMLHQVIGPALQQRLLSPLPGGQGVSGRVAILAGCLYLTKILCFLSSPSHGGQ